MSLTPSTTVRSADGSTLAVYELGGSGPVLLIAHATGFCAAMYRQLAGHLAARFRVVALDFRGHGNSARQEGIDLGWDRMGEDALAVVERAADGGRVHAMGHSMGGGALLLAAQAQPALFRTLYLFEPIVFPEGLPTEGQNLMAETARRRKAEFASRAELLYRYAARPPFDKLLAGVLVDYIDNGFDKLEHGHVRLKCLPEHEAQIFEGGRTMFLSRIAGVTTPTLVAVGHEEEGPSPSRFGRPLADTLAHAELRVYPNVGHFGPFQDPWTIARDLTAHAAAH